MSRATTTSPATSTTTVTTTSPATLAETPETTTLSAPADATRYHTVVIGAGSGGLTVAAGLSALGKRTALIEAAHVGGDCTNVGCVPSKTLIHLVSGTDAHGMSPAEVLREVQRRRDALRDHETDETRELPNLDLIPGRARLLARGTVAVRHPDGSERVVRAKNIVLATGARPRLLDIPGLPVERTLTNESLFELGDAPAHLVVVGSGVIGVEMAQAFAKLGTKVSVVSHADRVLERSDPEVAEVVQRAMEEQGIELHLGARTERYDDASGTLYVRRGGEVEALEGVDRVLLAVGRVPATHGLGLETVGLRVERGGLKTDGYGGTGVRGVYAVGDITQSSNFTHSANAQGRRLVQRLAFPFLPRLSPEPDYPSATFSDPEVAAVGPSLAELQARYHPSLLRTLRVDLADTDKGYTQGLDRGFVQLHVMRFSGRILGATIVAPKASEMITLITAHLHNRLSIYRLSELIFPYPVLGAAIKKAADAFVFATLPQLPQELAAYLRFRWARPARPDRKRRGERGGLEPATS